MAWVALLFDFCHNNRTFITCIFIITLTNNVMFFGGFLQKHIKRLWAINSIYFHLYAQCITSISCSCIGVCPLGVCRELCPINRLAGNIGWPDIDVYPVQCFEPCVQCRGGFPQLIVLSQFYARFVLGALDFFSFLFCQQLKSSTVPRVRLDGQWSMKPHSTRHLERTAHYSG